MPPVLLSGMSGCREELPHQTSYGRSMARKGIPRAHVSGDRLWDEEGDLWLGVRGAWATEADVERLVSKQCPVVVHGLGRSFRSLSARVAGSFWSTVRPHFEVPGSGLGAARDADGVTYSAQVWTRDGQSLLGFVENC